MAHSVAVSAYLERIEGLLADKTEASLLYAAVELRCGVETRIKEYLEPLEHIPKSKKRSGLLRNSDSVLRTHFALETSHDFHRAFSYARCGMHVDVHPCQLSPSGDCLSPWRRLARPESGAPSMTRLGGEIFENSLGKATGSVSSRTL